MTTAKSLTGLCTICYAEDPKYRCPRCKSQTCSLPCYKRHQQRASCNGQRNPATFIKKSEWATASGIDHDFNYLKSVERNIEQADDNVQPRTSDEHGSVKRSREQWRPDSALQRYLREHNITIQRAPEGMSRSRHNKTRHTQKGKVFWTVEFIDNTGNAYLDDDCLSSSKLVDLWHTAVSRKRKANTRGNADSSKRRRVEESSGGVTHSSTAKLQPCGDAPAGEAPAGEAGQDVQTGVSSEEATTTFYLVRPGVSSRGCILIPVDSEQCLSDILRSRTLQEYPTFYALPRAAHDLPESFILEEDYLSSLKNKSSTVQLPEEVSQQSKSTAVAGQPLQAEKILEMLRRDLG